MRGYEQAIDFFLFWRHLLLAFPRSKQLGLVDGFGTVSTSWDKKIYLDHPFLRVRRETKPSGRDPAARMILPVLSMLRISTLKARFFLSFVIQKGVRAVDRDAILVSGLRYVQLLLANRRSKLVHEL